LTVFEIKVVKEDMCLYEVKFVVAKRIYLKVNSKYWSAREDLRLNTDEEIIIFLSTLN
jgi:hypothetical protein